MNKTFVLLCSLLFIIEVPIHAETYSTENFHLYTPTAIYEDSIGVLLIKALDENGTPESGVANNISCYIRYPDGTMLVNGEHPVENVPGIYVLEFSTAETMGIYYSWATWSTANKTFIDAGLFTVKWDVYQNVSRLYERIGNIIYLGHWENNNMTQQFAYALAMHATILQNISRQSQQTDVVSNLQQIALSQAISVIFWVIILITFGVLSAIFYTRRKGKKLREEEVRAAGNVPQAIVEKVGEEMQVRRRRV